MYQNGVMGKNQSEKILKLIKQKGMLRPRDLDDCSIPRTSLQRLYQGGVITKISRGLYTLPGIHVTEHHTLAEAAKRVPNGVLCLLTALSFHGLTSQAPFQTWVAIDRKSRLPKVDYPSIRFVRFSAQALTEGIEEHMIDSVRVKIYAPAKTVADCFKYRNKIGIDVALEALKDCWSQRKCTMDDLRKYGKICRVEKVMKPYIQALL
jgi:predicted transcriptional regulator of viral defense system